MGLEPPNQRMHHAIDRMCRCRDTLEWAKKRRNGLNRDIRKMEKKLEGYRAEIERIAIEESANPTKGAS